MILHYIFITTRNLKLKKYRQQKGEAALDQADITDPVQKEQVEKALIAPAPTRRGAHKKSGEGVMALKGTAKVDASLIGGEASLKVIWQSKNREKIGTGTLSKKTLKYYPKAWEIELVGKMTIPLAELSYGTIFIEKLGEWLLKAKTIYKKLQLLMEQKLSDAQRAGFKTDLSFEGFFNF